MKNKNIDRRIFLQNLMKGIGILAIAPVLKGCENSLYPEKEVDPDLCIGCGRCLGVCYYSAIVLPQTTQYSVITSLCDKCMLCQPVCEKRAISVDETGYPVIDMDVCNSCGKCYPVCEPLAIHRELHKANIDSDKCYRCDKCTRVCAQNAIS